METWIHVCAHTHTTETEKTKMDTHMKRKMDKEIENLQYDFLTLLRAASNPFSMPQLE